MLSGREAMGLKLRGRCHRLKKRDENSVVLCLCFKYSLTILKSYYSSGKTVSPPPDKMLLLLFTVKEMQVPFTYSRNGHGVVATACLHRPFNSCFDINRHSGSVRQL